MSWPLNKTLPWSGSTSRLAILSSVDLPEPDAPIITTNSPGAIVSDNSLTAGTAPKDLLTACHSIIAAGPPKP